MLIEIGAIVLVIALFVAICIIYVLFLIIKGLKESFLNANKIAKETLKECIELSNKNFTRMIAINILMMKLSAANNNFEKFTNQYHFLYFQGVPQNVLNDADKLDDFIKDCIEGKLQVKDGEKPFYNKFIKKEK